MATSRRRALANIKGGLPFSPEDSPVSLIRPQASDLDQVMTDISGQNSIEQWMRLNPHGLWQKMFLDYLVGTEAWCSTRSVLTWKVKATKSYRLYFLLQARGHPTADTGSSLLPTPVVMDTNAGDLEKIDLRRETAKAKKYNGNGMGSTLMELAQRGLLPTPTASSGGAEPESRTTGKKLVTISGLLPSPGAAEPDKASASDHQNSLTRMLKRGELLPTPAARDFKGQNSLDRTKKSEAGNFGDQLPNYLQHRIGKTFQLSPRFVAEMMGFPVNWTELPFQTGEEVLLVGSAQSKPGGVGGAKPSKSTGTP